MKSLISDIKREIIAELEELRTIANAKCEKKKAEIYEKYPEVLAFSKKINLLGLENTKRIFKNPENAAEYNKEFKIELEKLLAERDEFYKEHGIDPDFDKKQYRCKKCSDTGFIKSGEMCSCFKERLAEKTYRISSLGKTMQDMRFENFSLDYYSSEKKGDYSERENMEYILNSAKAFCEKFEEHERSILFYGTPGLGKTFISVSVARKLLELGKTVTYISAARLFSIYEDYKFGRDHKNDEFFDDLFNSDLLIIDDLGTEFISKASVSFLFELVNERIINNKKVIINTNLSPEDLEREYTVRFMSRIFEHFDVYKFTGKDIRVQKQYN